MRVSGVSRHSPLPLLVVVVSAVSLVVVAALTLNKSIGVRGLELAELSRDLERYVNADEFQWLVEMFHKHQDWIKEQFPDERDNNRYVYLLVVSQQLELSARNQAIKRQMAAKVAHLSYDLMQKPLEFFANDSSVRDATLELMRARAQLRAKLTMLHANPYHWTALFMMMSGHLVYYNGLIGHLNSTMPRDSLEPSAEIAEQTPLLDRYFEAMEAAARARGQPTPPLSSYRVYRALDKTLDQYTECGSSCEKLLEPQHTNAGPLVPDFRVIQWADEFVETRAALESARQVRAQVAEHLRLTNIYLLAREPYEQIEHFRADSLRWAASHKLLPTAGGAGNGHQIDANAERSQ